MKLVEVIPRLFSSAEGVEKVSEIAKGLGKALMVVNELAGFVVNRVLILLINETVGIYAEDVQHVECIDTSMKLGANHPMGRMN